MAKNNKLPEIFDLCRVLRDSYRQKYDDAVKTRDDAIRFAKTNYVRQSPMLKQSLESARLEFANTIDALKTETRQALADELEKLKTAETAKVLQSPIGIERFKALESVPLSMKELSIIAKQHGGKDYYIDRYIQVLADKNGIDTTDPDAFPLMTSIDDKLEALQSLADGLEDLLTNYDENKSVKALSALSDRTLMRIENKYIGSERTALTLEQRTDRAYATIASMPRQLERANAIGNALRNCPDKRSRDALLLKLAENPVGDLAEHLSAPSAIQAFRDNKGREYHAAEDALAKLTKAGQSSQWNAVHDILTAHKDNEFFPAMAEDILKSSQKATEIAQSVNLESGSTVYDVL